MASSFFDDDGKSMEPSVDDFPPPLASGVVLDQRYGTSAKSLSALICKAGSPFIQELLTCLKTTEYSEEPWKRANNGCIERVVSYMKAATKIIKAVKASESHTCRRLDDRGFILDISCSTPDVPYGSNFMVKLQVGSFKYAESFWFFGKKIACVISFRISMSSCTKLTDICNAHVYFVDPSFAYWRDKIYRHKKKLVDCKYLGHSIFYTLQ